MVIAIAIAGLVFGAAAVHGEVASQLKGLLGDTGAQAVEAMLTGASKPAEGILATILGVGTLIFAAVGVVVQRKDALNTVWEVEPPKEGGVWAFVRTYIVSLPGVLAVGFLLLISLLLTTLLSAGGKYIAPYLPEAALQVAGSLVSFGVITMAVCHDVQVATGRPRGLAKCLAWGRSHRYSFRSRQTSDRPLHWQAVS